MAAKSIAGKCNICGYPAIIEYKEQDPDTGAIVVKKHTVKCSGHYGLHPLFWNGHPDHQAMANTYQKMKTAKIRRVK